MVFRSTNASKAMLNHIYHQITSVHYIENYYIGLKVVRLEVNFTKGRQSRSPPILGIHNIIYNKLSLLARIAHFLEWIFAINFTYFAMNFAEKKVGKGINR